MNAENSITIVIRPLRTTAEAEVCAQMMAGSEPWITLRRDAATAFNILTDPTREVYLAICNTEIVGFTILLLQGVFVGYIQSICVAPNWRGCGIGSQLIGFTENRIFRDTPNAFILVSSFNPSAQKLYERMGYEVIGELKDYIVPGHSEVLLRKSIAPLTEFKQKG